MHFPTQNPKGTTFKPKLIENRPNNYPQRDYEDEQQTLTHKGSDNAEVRDLKNKMKLVMAKLTNVKKEKEELQKQNKVLQDEVVGLQSNLREMVSGFSNTSSSFPTHNEIGNKFAEFYKYECLDFFFDVLSPNMSLKGVITFYRKSFQKTHELLQKYFTPCFKNILVTGCFQTIQGPIMNVLRKALQTTHSQIYQKIKRQGQTATIMNFVVKTLQMQNEFEQFSSQFMDFLNRIVQLSLVCFISDPPFEINIEDIGKRVNYNPLLHEPFDGFIKPKEECWIVLPSVRKISEEKQIVTKSQVLQLDYEQIN